MNRFWIILIVVVLGLIGLFIVTKPASDNGGTDPEASKAVQEDDHVKWSTEAAVTLIEYGDFQCPACGSYYPILKELEKTHGESVRFVFRHFPLRNIHPNAQAAALAAEAAGQQDKFWEMHDKLFETQTAWGRITTNQQKLFEGYAQELGLDLEQFRKDYTDPATAQRINRDLESGKAFGATGTPTFVLNGKQIETPADLAAFQKVLDEALEKSGTEQSAKQQ